MSQRRVWIAVLGGGALGVLGLAGLLWWQHGRLVESRERVAGLHQSIESSRKLIESSPALERDVIVLRELSEVMKGCLPDHGDVNKLVRTLQSFSEGSRVRISALKKKIENANRKDKGDFDKVAYTLSLEGDAWQLLDFLDRIESHSRFMRVPNFRITAANRSEMEKAGVPAHKVTIDVETFVYEPRKGDKPVKIDGYDRKRALLLGEIERRKGALSVASYAWRGARGRRDPWIDPRVPVQPDAQSTLPLQEQMDLVEQLAERTQQVLAKWEQVRTAENVIVEMTARVDMEEQLARLEEDVRRVLAEKLIAFVPSQTRLQAEIVEPLNQLRSQLSATEVGHGPSQTQLIEVEKTMLAHRVAGEHKLVLATFAAVDARLGQVENDPLRKPLVERLRELAAQSRAVQDFDKLKLEVGGVVLIEGGTPIAMINGRSLTEGDVLDKQLVVRAIRSDEIEFIFRGLVFARRF